MGRGDSSMPSVVTSSKDVLPDKARVSPWRVTPTVVATVAFASVGGAGRVAAGEDV